MSVFDELKRRNVFRVGAAYLVLAWLVIQVTDTVGPALNLPEWTLTLVVWIGIVGFPFALLFAWAFELTPDGLQRERDVDRAASITPATGKLIDRVIILLLAAGVAVLLVDRYLPGTGGTGEGETAPAAALAVGYDSIAVLPFVNMSSDAEQDYFSDGIAEELLNLLARINGLKVAARTSSFAFRGEEQDVRMIGTALDVDTVLEGSVRKAGNRIRVTAQLISTEDGYHLWSDTFDRELTDVFQIQDDISGSIVSALRVHIDPGYEPVKSSRTASLEAYDLYLQGRHEARRGYPGSLDSALALFRQATQADPGYAPAWAAQALMVVFLRESPFWEGIPAAEAVELAQSSIDQALALDPDLAEAHVAQSALYWEQYEFDRSLASIDRALGLNPSLASAHVERATALVSLGRIAEARQARLTAAELDPLDMSIMLRTVGLAREYRDVELLDEVAARLADSTAVGHEHVIALAELARFELRESNLARVYQQYDMAADNAPDDTQLKQRFERMRDVMAISLNERTEAMFRDGRNPPLLRFVAAVSVEGNETQAWERYNTLPQPLQSIPIVQEEVSILQMREGDCASGLDTLARAHGGKVPIYGQTPPNMLRANANLAANRVYCLKALGRAAEADGIARQLRPFLGALRDGAPGGYELLDIKMAVIDGQTEAAMEKLENAIRTRRIGYEVWGDPVVKSLEGLSGYGELRAWLEHTIDAERSELGWPPARWH